MAWRNVATNLLLAVTSLLLVALLAEGALRFVLLRNLNPFERDPDLEYRLKASFDGLYPRTPVRTDALRRRIPVDAAGPAGTEVLFVGDSVTFGFGVLAEEAYPYGVGELLGDTTRIANAAVPGYNLEQVLGALRRELAARRPKVVVYGLVINDVYGTLRPLTYEEIDPQAARMEDGGFLAHSILVAFVQRRWNRIAASFGDPEPSARPERGTLEQLEASLPPGAIEAFDQQWRALEALQRDAGVPVVILICPHAGQVAEATAAEPLRGVQEFVLARCVGSALVCLDPLALFQSRGVDEMFNPGSSMHFSPRGHDLLAEWLVERLPSE